MWSHPRPFLICRLKAWRTQHIVHPCTLIIIRLFLVQLANSHFYFLCNRLTQRLSQPDFLCVTKSNATKLRCKIIIFTMNTLWSMLLPAAEESDAKTKSGLLGLNTEWKKTSPNEWLFDTFNRVEGHFVRNSVTGEVYFHSVFSPSSPDFVSSPTQTRPTALAGSLKWSIKMHVQRLFCSSYLKVLHMFNACVWFVLTS